MDRCFLVSKIKDYLKSLSDVAKKNKALQDENDALRAQNKELLLTLSNDAKAEFERKNFSVLSIKLEDCDLSVRAINCTKKADVVTIGDLLRYNRYEVKHFRNMGEKTMKELDRLLDLNGLSWKE